ncbi:hypothetical protein [Chryseobacterium profundimaris]|uniref:Glycosyl transferase family 28 C-terminal domain-containing protein n=1 Tax=Chryseobacterium profundimaris TaxID=1387275 RepID=A0ABY1P4W4_9FLAO|nr:hypothetical protein [Chryseobacterium profundimaris]SMP25629.1 hypothetical protein SAMN06264346_108181 [Chryseobacterium profundimaris]
MDILTIPYFAGGLSHLIPLYVLHHKYLKNKTGITNQFLVDNNLQPILKMQGIDCVSVDYTLEENLIVSDKNASSIKDHLKDVEKKAYETIKPSLIIEDTSFFTPLIAEKNNLPRISIQRTGIFRSIDKQYRNVKHVHSLEKGSNSLGNSRSFSDPFNPEPGIDKNSDLYFLQQYANPKAKIIPGIPSIEQLPENIKNRESYFYSGPLIVMDKPSKKLSLRLEEFLNNNKEKPVVFITTGTIDRTPIENFIEFFVQRNYAVITTCLCEINEKYNQEILYNKLLPLHYICGISNLVIHQCGSGMYHYPIMNRVPSFTISTQCYDREDIALRLQELGVSAHIPHPDDNPDYWNIFLEKVERFENKNLIDYKMMDHLQNEINETMANFNMEKVIEYALT